MKQHNKIKFEVGTTVSVLKDYRQDSSPWRETPGVIVRHDTDLGADLGMDPFVDNYIRFETGEIEPFANWEIEATK